MSGRPEMSTTLQDPNIEPASSAPASIALIGPNATHRRVMAEALGNSDARSVREFVDYPANLGDVPHLIDEGFDVVMIDVDSDQSYALQIIESIARYNSTIVMAYSMRNDADLIRDCMRAGARDFLPLPEEASSEPDHEIEAEPEEQLQAVPEPQAAPAAEPSLNPADFLRSPQAVVEEEPEEAPLNPADFLLPSARENTTPAVAAPAAPPQDYVVPSRPQFVDPRKNGPQAAPPSQPVAQAAPAQPAPPVKPAPVEVRRADPAPAPNVHSEALRHPAPAAPQKAPGSAPAGEPKKEDDIDTWDSLWIHPALAAQQGKPIEKPAAPSSEGQAKKKAAAVSGPQLVQRAAAAAVAAAPARVAAEPVPTASPAPAAAAAAPLFRQVEPETSVHAQRPWVRWAIFGGAPLVIIGLILMIFLPAHKSSIPAATPTQTQSVPTQGQAAAATAPAAASVDAKPSAKPSAATPLEEEPAQGPAVSSQMMNAQLNAPSRISGSIKKPAAQGEEPGAFTAGMDTNSALPGQVFGGSRQVKVEAPVSAISSGVADGLLLRKTSPVYPEIAKQAHVSGTVVLGANITKAGSLTNLHVLSGPTMLRAPALDAVKTWHYRPYMLNNQPVEVETTIRVVFSLEGR
jgi:periplasmic protein TonB